MMVGDQMAFSVDEKSAADAGHFLIHVVNDDFYHRGLNFFIFSSEKPHTIDDILNGYQSHFTIIIIDYHNKVVRSVQRMGLQPFSGIL